MDKCTCTKVQITTLIQIFALTMLNIFILTSNIFIVIETNNKPEFNNSIPLNMTLIRNILKNILLQK